MIKGIKNDFPHSGIPWRIIKGFIKPPEEKKRERKKITLFFFSSGFLIEAKRGPSKEGVEKYM
jgi:hypothetical protein